MPQVLHNNAKLTIPQRIMIKESNKPIRQLAEELGVSVPTILKWKHREAPHDRKSGPKVIRSSFEVWQEEVILEVRRRLELPLDDLLEVTRRYIKPDCTRSSLERLLRRRKMPSIRELRKKRESSGEHNEFKVYEPGFVHMDVKYLPKIDKERMYLFVAIDRATRSVFYARYDHKDEFSAEDFVRQALDFFPFKINKLLTDNGKEFLNDIFETVVKANEIEHRRIRPYRPQTNGMVERFNRRISEVITDNKVNNHNELWEILVWYLVDYNFRSPQRVLEGMTPYEKMLEWYTKKREIFWIDPREHFRNLINKFVSPNTDPECAHLLNMADAIVPKVLPYRACNVNTKKKLNLNRKID